MKSIMRAATVLAVITATAPGIVDAQEANCRGQCDGIGTVVANTASPAASTSDDPAKTIGELLGNQTLSTVTTVVVTHAPLDDTTRSSFITGMTVAEGAVNGDVRPTVEAAVSIGGSLGGGIGSGIAGTMGAGTSLGGSIVPLGPLAALGGALNGIASGN